MEYRSSARRFLSPHVISVPAIRVTLALLSGGGPAAAWCQAEVLQEAQVIHWAYGAFLGTGWYSLDESREVFILKAPLEWQWRAPAAEHEGWRQAGITFQAPFSLGVHRLDDLGEIVDVDNVGTISLTPGVEIDWPWHDRLMLRGYAHAGYGHATGNGESAWIYDLGFRGRYGFRHQDLDWALVGEIFHVGFDPRSVPASSLGGLMGGAQFSRPFEWRQNALEWRWDLSWRWMGNPLTFLNQDRSLVSIDDEWQVSASIGRAGQPFRVGFMRFAQFGLSYRFSSDGEFRAITLVFSPLFDR